MTQRSRRRGRGAIYSYKTASGVRWRWQLWVPVDPEIPDGEQRRTSGAGYKTSTDADAGLHDAVTKLRNQEKFSTVGAPTLAVFAADWLKGLRLAPSTIQGYDKIIRNHIVPQLGDIKIDKLTSTRIARHYRDLEAHGRRDSKAAGAALSANTVNKIHIVLGSILEAAIDDELISNNPARKRTVKAPTGKQIRAQRPEITTWSADELNRFLAWDRDIFDDDLFPLWRTVAFSGMRRSEAIALRWGDVDFVNGRISVRRAADVTTRNVAKSTKTGRARVVDMDPVSLDVLKAYKAVRGSIALDLARPDSYVFGNLGGAIRSPNEVGRRWTFRVETAQKVVSDLTRITLQELRHTHATLLLENGEHPKVVQERLGHSTISTTMNIYSHVTPTMQKAASNRFAELVSRA